MNVTEFARSIDELEAAFSHARAAVPFDGNFPYEERESFDKALNKLLFVLHKDSDITRTVADPWHAAYRIVKLSSLADKISEVRRRILRSSCPPYFSKKIRNAVLPAIDNRIDDLKHKIGFLGRLPFNPGLARDDFFQKVKKKLALEETEETWAAEKEYFHLLGNEFETDLGDINTKPLNGNLEIYSLLSWREVLSALNQSGNVDESGCRKLLKIIENALPIALKTSFALNLPQMQRESPFADLDYFKDFLQLKRDPSASPNEFQRKYVLGENRSIPSRVLINEIAWDAVENIDRMAQGDVRLFVLGTMSHSIAIEISCIEPPSLRSVGHYDYKIINTGLGVDGYHRLKSEAGEDYAKPAIIKGLSRSILSYDFLNKLVYLSLQKNSVDAFYQLHKDDLMDKGRGRLDLDSADWIKLQKFDTCSYTAVEAWINTYLTPKQQKHFDFIKAKISVKKQKKIVSLLQADSNKDGWMIRSKSRRYWRLDKGVRIKKKRLRESTRLLELGKSYRGRMAQRILENG